MTVHNTVHLYTIQLHRTLWFPGIYMYIFWFHAHNSLGSFSITKWQTMKKRIHFLITELYDSSMEKLRLRLRAYNSKLIPKTSGANCSAPEWLDISKYLRIFWKAASGFLAGGRVCAWVQWVTAELSSRGRFSQLAFGTVQLLTCRIVSSTGECLRLLSQAW